ncbi:amino acid ABC transporter substrate-binding protein [Thalassotalea sp. M1531]|uniref:Amino acid ABC transporter substrate-binding protein n=1 Tax=Thalassotalea algicola TaxID=2716224 RepID=A0A7Y0LDE8_9GAMM|nr:transporter substrate-binding domain-containing protein [Thalassotalea algicola]NMP32514.1 amino acid ABC transporter substrate-binding protein [Thalassotalea algicola]
MRNAMLSCFVVLFSVKGLAATGKTLTVGFGAHNSPPYALIKGEVNTGGVIADIIGEISDSLDINSRFVFVPRKRIEKYLLDGTIDFYLISNPKWISHNALIWTIPIFKEKNVIVVKKESKDYETLEDLHQKTVGTIRGFVYPSLTEAFDTQYISRTDVRSLKLNFERLSKGWIDGFIDSDILIDYVFKEHNYDDDFKVASYLVSEHLIYGVLSPKSDISIEEINNALDKLITEGVISAILSKYRINESGIAKKKK